MSLITNENYSSHPVGHGFCAERNCENRLSKTNPVSALSLLEADRNPLELKTNDLSSLHLGPSRVLVDPKKHQWY